MARQKKGVESFGATAIILNSVVLRKHVPRIVEKYQFRKVYLFLDNDDYGRDTVDYFEQA
jgi:5S rRNA maturation endonuclease (ribonuclease M5)